ncbi:MAG: hypothetical protein J6B26_04450 [Agathobacter sp.]|nr:hypothetical protein [Agathobacter sp.]MBQ2283368.1 hypothetical protein [Agathobacter sp.]
MFEVYVLVEKKKPIIIKIFAITMLVLGVLGILCSCITPIFMMSGFLFIVIWALLWFFNNVEYEYSYFDGDVRFAKILNKSKRKRLKGYDIDAVQVIAPAGDRSLYKYEQDSSVKKVDYTSGDKKVPYYQMAVKNEDVGMVLISFEPDDKYLDAVCVKHPQKVIRRPAEQ